MQISPSTLHIACYLLVPSTIQDTLWYGRFLMLLVTVTEFRHRRRKNWIWRSRKSTSAYRLSGNSLRHHRCYDKQRRTKRFFDETKQLLEKGNALYHILRILWENFRLERYSKPIVTIQDDLAAKLLVAQSSLDRTTRIASYRPHHR